MILKGAAVDRFVRKPDAAIRATLIYGPDYGLVQERAKTLAAAVGDPADPFAFVVLKSETIEKDPARLADEAAALTFSGKRRVIRIRGGGDGLARAFAAWLEEGAGEAFVIAEAADLGKRSALRALFEKSRRGAAIACYADSEAATLRLIAQVLGEAGLTAEPDAAALIVASVGADHGVTRSELEKLVLYMGGAEGGGAKASGAGAGRRVTLADVAACIDSSTTTSLDAICEAVCLGDMPGLDTLFHRLVRESEHQPVTLLRAVARHMQRLLLAGGLIAAGRAPAQAMAQVKPPVFPRNQESFRRQLALWPPERVGAALAILTGAELDCKSTGMPEQAVCERALLRIARAAATTAAARG